MTYLFLQCVDDVTYLFLQRVDDVVQQRDGLAGAGARVQHVVERGGAEAQGVAALAAVHVVATGQHQLQQALQLATAEHLLARRVHTCQRR